MTTDFLDTTEWDNRLPQSVALIDALAERFSRRDELVNVAGAAGIPEEDLDLHAHTVRLLWMATLADAANRGRLRSLVEAGIEAKLALGNTIHAILATTASSNGGGPWYRHPDPFACRFIGPGSKRSMIDRFRLRGLLQELIREETLGLVVRGSRGSGKSHSWHLVSHVERVEKSFVPVRVSVETIKKAHVTATDIAEKLCSRLGIQLDIGGEPGEPVVSGGEIEQAEATARLILDDVIGAFPRDNVRRWIVLDGFDRAEATPSARLFAVGLLDAVVQQEIVDTCVLITGLEEALSADMDGLVQEESIAQLTFTDVREFFSKIAEHTGQPVDGPELDDIAEEILAGGAGDTAALMQEITSRAIERFAP